MTLVAQAKHSEAEKQIKNECMEVIRLAKQKNNSNILLQYLDGTYAADDDHMSLDSKYYDRR